MRAATLPRHEKKGEHPVNANDAQLTELTTKQSDYITVPKAGPFKPDTFGRPRMPATNACLRS